MAEREAIEVVWGRADASAPLSAFDAALAEAGIHNCNLVTYSSIVPPDRPVETVGRTSRDLEVGTPLATVVAENDAVGTDETVAAGLGWILADEGGVLMESSADSTADCRADLRRKLEDARALRDWHWRGEAETVVREHVVDGAGAVVVAAVYGPLAEVR